MVKILVCFNVGCPKIDLVKHSLQKKIKNLDNLFFKNGVEKDLI